MGNEAKSSLKKGELASINDIKINIKEENKEKSLKTQANQHKSYYVSPL